MRRRLSTFLVAASFLSLGFTTMSLAIPSRTNGDVPGFHVGMPPAELDVAHDSPDPTLDLTLFSAMTEGQQTRIRLGCLSPFQNSKGALRLDASGSSFTLDHQGHLSDEKGQNLGQFAFERMSGAAVSEVLLPIHLDGVIKVQTVDSTNRLMDELQFSHSSSMGSLEPISRDRQNHHVAFVHHGNQGLTWTDVLWGDESYAHEQHFAEYLDTESQHNGFDEILGLHDVLDVTGNFHMSGTIQVAAQWYYPGGDVEGFNDWISRGVTEGWASLLTSAWAQHIMPFAMNSMNDWAVATQADMTEWRYGYTPRVAWVPERVWVSPDDNDGNGVNTSAHVNDWIGDNWLPHGVWGVILDQGEHCGYEDNWANDRHIYQIDTPDGDLNVIPISGSFTGDCHHNSGNAWNAILATSSDELLLYGTDWEVVAEVAGFGDMFPDALNNMIWLVQQIAGSGGSVQSVALDQALGDFDGGDINLQNGTYGMLGGIGGYGSDWLSPGTHNSWYGHFAGDPSHSDHHTPAWDYGSVWVDTWQNLMSLPENDLTQTAWFVFMTNMYETGWHDGTEISGWIHRYASHIKNANVYAEAARWADGQYPVAIGIEQTDIDRDGDDEWLMYNDKIFVVFEAAGGRAPWIFAKEGEQACSVVGSCASYWVDTDGDFNDGMSNNHEAAFSEVSPNHEHEMYTMSIDEDDASLVRLRASNGSITKTFELLPDQNVLLVNYETSGETWVSHGFSPDLKELFYTAEMQRLWDGSQSWPNQQWMGQRNPHSGMSAALVLGNGGATHGADFQGTLVRGDEVRGNGNFSYFFYAGLTSEPDGTGSVAELQALADTSNLDLRAPQMAAVAAFQAPDLAIVDFDERVDEASVSNLAAWELVDFPPSATLISASRQADQSMVALQISGLQSGDTGSIHALSVTDLAGNSVDPTADVAILAVPNGLTPHTILIDGGIDFTESTELMEEGGLPLYITWDSAYLYVGHEGTSLGTGGDLFFYIDVNLVAGSGAATSSWGRVDFGSGLRPEFEVAIEGGGDSMQLNSYSGASWTYQQYGEHGGTSYEGWSSNTTTEFRIPWEDLGNPTDLAFSASRSTENSNTTLNAWPSSNPIGSSVTFSDWWIFAEADLPGPMPTMGVAPNAPVTSLPPVNNLQITRVGEGFELSWDSVPGAMGYRIYSSAQGYAPFELLDETVAAPYFLPSASGRAFYQVTAID
jgi:hypothetical protein